MLRKLFQFFSLFLGLMLLFLLYWLDRKFGDISISQFVFHLQHSNTLTRGYNTELHTSFISNVLLIPLIICILYLLAVRLLKEKFPHVLRSLICFGSLITGLGIFLVHFSIPEYLWHLNDDDTFLETHYRSPTIKTLPQNPRNLILVYVESLEQGYTNKDLFARNLLPELSKLPGNSLNYQQVYGSGWTMAGIVTSQCGLPIKSIMIEDRTFKEESTLTTFLPNAICLGDLLKELGYKNIFLYGGTDNFMGKKAFLETHGYTVFGKNHWLQKNYPNSAFNEFGGALNDDYLLQNARTVLDDLMKKQEPFNLSILTVNMHDAGYPFETCPVKDPAENFKDFLSCTDVLIADFIQYAIDKGYTDSTDIIIIGDHLTHNANPLSDILDSQEKRSIYNRWITKQTLPENSSSLHQMDVGATILELMGFELDQHRLGLGQSILSTHRSEEDMSHFLDQFEDHVDNNSEFYNRLWVQ